MPELPSWVMPYIPILTALLTGGVAVWTYLKTRSNALVRERYEKLFFPMFRVLEPCLFKPLNAESKIALNKAIQIYEQNRMLAGGRLEARVYMCTPVSTCKKDDYMELCHYVNIHYDRLCKKLGIPVRSLIYRANRRQFKTVWGMILFVLWYILLSVAVFVVCFASFVTVYGLITLLLQ